MSASNPTNPFGVHGPLAVFGGFSTSAINQQHWPSAHFQHTFSVRYTGSDWEVVGTMRNAFDKQPPAVGAGVPRNETSRIFDTLPGMGYDLIGRRFAVHLVRQL